MTFSQKFPVSFWKNPYQKRGNFCHNPVPFLAESGFLLEETLETCFPSSTPYLAMRGSTQETAASHKAVSVLYTGNPCILKEFPRSFLMCFLTRTKVSSKQG